MINSPLVFGCRSLSPPTEDWDPQNGYAIHRKVLRITWLLAGHVTASNAFQFIGGQDAYRFGRFGGG
jgi:hypothetical protein